MDEHHGFAQCAAVGQFLFEVEEVVILKTHAAQHDHIGLGLQGDSGKELVIGLTGNGEDGELLGNHQRVEHIDHGNVGAQHAVCQNSLGGVDGGAADGFHIFGQRGAAISRLAGAVEDSSQQILAEGNAHLVAQEADFVTGRNALAAGENLKRNQAAVNFVDLCKGLAEAGVDLCQLVIAHAFCSDGDHVAGDGFNSVENFIHAHSPSFNKSSAFWLIFP